MNEAADAAEVREYLAIIRRNIELEARLVDDLLDVTRITQGKLRIHSTPTDLHAILHDALTMINPALRDKQITPVLNLAKEKLMIRGDAARLTQVFSNLIGNAAKFSHPGSQVTIRSSQSADKLRVEIEDTGIGIVPELLPQIFDPFRQGQVGTTRRFGGLGLGLSVAKGLVEAHGGTISVRSAGHKQGATFTVELPVIAAGSVQENSPASPSPGPVTPAHSLRVLLVEDHDDTRHVLHRLMTRWNHSVTVASTLAAARKALEEKTFDLLLSDIGLPDGSGFEVIAAERSDIPAIAMSGYGMEADIARVHAAGFTEHIVKPVTAEVLRKMLNHFSTRPEP